MYDIVIIGGGITGLTAAHTLAQINQTRRHPLTFTVLESDSHIGGKIATHMVETDHGPFLLEQGADSFLTTKPFALELARELKLDSELITTNNHQRRIFVLRSNRLRVMPDGMQLMIPTRVLPFVTSNLISWQGKARAALEGLVLRRNALDDESVANFVRRRFGQEVLDYIAEPLLSGIYNSDAERQSLKATFPQFDALEQRYGSLIRGMMASPKSSGGFVSFRRGMSTLITALGVELDSVIQLSTAVRDISYHQLYELALSDGRTVRGRQLLLTSSASQTARLIREVAPMASDRLSQFRCTSSGSIYFAYARQDIKHPLNGFGVVIPKPEQRSINAITWTSSKWPSRAPSDMALLRVFFGGSRRPDMNALSDNDLEQQCRRELRDIMNIEARPLFSRIFRSVDSNPQYDLGHLDRLDQIETALPPGIAIAGSAYRGVGIPDCVRQGKLAAIKMASSLFLALICFTSCITPLQDIQNHLGIRDLSSFSRAPRTERWHLTDDPKWNRSRLRKDFGALGLVHSIGPRKKHYHSAVLRGAAGPNMHRRIDYLVKLWSDGVRFDRVVFLTGDRPLSEIDDYAGPAQNETALFKLLWDNTPKPTSLAALPTLWIDTPGTIDADGKFQRPTTVTTIVRWRETENLRGEDLLAISNQPFVKYQQCALDNFMPRGAQIETVGPQADPDTLSAVYLNAIAQDIQVCRIFP